MWAALFTCVTVLIGLYMFKEPIAAFLSSFSRPDRNAKFSFLGVDIQLGSDPSQEQIKSGQINNGNVPFLKAFHSVILSDEEKIIRLQLEKSMINKDQAIDTLITHLANSNIVGKMTVLSLTLNQGQVELLFFLNGKYTLVQEECFYPYYAKTKRSGDYSFKNFVESYYNIV